MSAEVMKVVRESKNVAAFLRSSEALLGSGKNAAGLDTGIGMYAMGEPSHMRTIWANARRAKRSLPAWIRALASVTHDYPSRRNPAQALRLLKRVLSLPAGLERTRTLRDAVAMARTSGVARGLLARLVPAKAIRLPDDERKARTAFRKAAVATWRKRQHARERLDAERQRVAKLKATGNAKKIKAAEKVVKAALMDYRAALRADVKLARTNPT